MTTTKALDMITEYDPDIEQPPPVRCTQCGLPFTGPICESAPCKYRRRQKELQRAASKRRREHPRALVGVDVDAVVAWMLKLPVFEELIPKRKGGRKLKVSVGHKARATYNGRAWSWRFEIRVAAGPDATPAQVLVVILHELTHIATPRARHNERFRRVLQRALREAWGLDIPLDPPVENEKLIAYAMDRLAMTALAKEIEHGVVDTFPHTPESRATRSRAELSQKLVEKRAAHAAMMLVRAERKLKLAKTVQQRWAKKVGYYERAAAKRGES